MQIPILVIKSVMSGKAWPTCHVDLLFLFVSTRNVLEEALQSTGGQLEEWGKASLGAPK